MESRSPSPPPVVRVPTLTVLSAQSSSDTADSSPVEIPWRPTLSVGSRFVMGPADSVTRIFQSMHCPLDPSSLPIHFDGVGEIVEIVSPQWVRVLFRRQIPSTAANNGTTTNNPGSPHQAAPRTNSDPSMSLRGDAHRPKSLFSSATPQQATHNSNSTVQAASRMVADSLLSDHTMEVVVTVPAAALTPLIEHLISQQEGLFEHLTMLIRSEQYRAAATLLEGVALAPRTAVTNDTPNFLRLQSFLLLVKEPAADPDCSALLVCVAELCLQAGGSFFADSINYATEAVRFDPTNLDAYRIAATALFVMNRLDEADAVISSSYFACPRRDTAFSFLALAVRVARFYKPLMATHNGFTVIPASLDRVLDCARQAGGIAKHVHRQLGLTSLSIASLPESFGRDSFNYAGELTLSSHYVRLVTLLDGANRKLYYDQLAVLVIPPGQDSDCCQHCGYPLPSMTPGSGKSAEILAEVEALSSSLANIVRRTLPSPDPCECGGGCGVRFCSAVCRSRAYLQYHFLECNVQGKQKPTPPTQSTDSIGSTLPFPSAAQREISFVFPQELSMQPVPPGARRRSSMGDRYSANQVMALVRATARRLSTISPTGDDIVSYVRVSIQGFEECIAPLLPQGGPVIRHALLLVKRMTSTMLSLLFPGMGSAAAEMSPTAEKDLLRDRSQAIKRIIGRCEARGLSASACRTPVDRADAHHLFIAEEVLHELNIPFFSDVLSQRSLSLAEIDLVHAAKLQALPISSAPALHAQLLSQISSYMTRFAVSLFQRCGKDAVAFSIVDSQPLRMPSIPNGKSPPQENRNFSTISSNSSIFALRRPSAVWTVADNEADVHIDSHQEPVVWSIDRLMGFLEKPRFWSQLWNLCLTSQLQVRRSGLAATVGELPQHLSEPWGQLCRSHSQEVVVIAPILSLAADVTTSSSTDLLLHQLDPYSKFRWEAVGSGSSGAELKGSGMLSVCSQNFEPETTTRLETMGNPEMSNVTVGMASVPGSRLLPFSIDCNAKRGETLRIQQFL